MFYFAVHVVRLLFESSICSFCSLEQLYISPILLFPVSLTQALSKCLLFLSVCFSYIQLRYPKVCVMSTNVVKRNLAFKKCMQRIFINKITSFLNHFRFRNRRCLLLNSIALRCFAYI